MKMMEDQRSKASQPQNKTLGNHSPAIPIFYSTSSSPTNPKPFFLKKIGETGPWRPWESLICPTNLTAFSLTIETCGQHRTFCTCQNPFPGCNGCGMRRSQDLMRSQLKKKSRSRFGGVHKTITSRYLLLPVPTLSVGAIWRNSALKFCVERQSESEG